jgi:FtsP/CotA-like multicopper oxidase with cupredoxin domain
MEKDNSFPIHNIFRSRFVLKEEPRMRGKSILVICVVLAAVALSLALIPSGTAQAQVGGKHIVYNLFATDGYYELPDNTATAGSESATYIYGFVGGRAGEPFTYQNSYCTGDGAARTCNISTNVTLPDAPQPVPGPIAGVEAQLAGNAQFPAPVIYAAQGDIVEIRLKNLGVNANPNAPNDPHSVHLHGLDVDAANDGVPETSVGAVPANLCTNGVTAPAGTPCSEFGEVPEASAGNVIVYMFTPEHPGTYMYHCHQEADIHVNMGMFGALVVYNPDDPAYLAGFDVNGDPQPGGGPGQGLSGTLYGHRYDKDYILLLGEFDIRGHADEEGVYGGLVPANTWDPNPYNWALYEPQYWFVNGLSFPNTIQADMPSGYTWGEWIAAHPGYDPLITGSVSRMDGFAFQHWQTPGEKVLIRVINMGFETQPMHMHGYHGKVIGSDQRAWPWANNPANARGKNHTPFGEGLEKNTLTVGSGETYDWLVDFGQQSFSSFYPDGTGGIQGTFPGGTQSCIDVNGNPVSPYDAACDQPAFWEGDIYIQGPEVTGLFSGKVTSQSQYFPFHNHDDYKATNNGVYPGGMFTFLVPTP